MKTTALLTGLVLCRIFSSDAQTIGDRLISIQKMRPGGQVISDPRASFFLYEVSRPDFTYRYVFDSSKVCTMICKYPETTQALISCYKELEVYWQPDTFYHAESNKHILGKKFVRGDGSVLEAELREYEPAKFVFITQRYELYLEGLNFLLKYPNLKIENPEGTYFVNVEMPKSPAE